MGVVHAHSLVPVQQQQELQLQWLGCCMLRHQTAAAHLPASCDQCEAWELAWTFELGQHVA